MNYEDLKPYPFVEKPAVKKIIRGGPTWTRTRNRRIMSPTL